MEQDPEVSKSQRKRDMHALQALGKTLIELPQEKLAKMDLPEPLRDAVMEARRISARGALRRQLQYVGRLMRDAYEDENTRAIVLRVNSPGGGLLASELIRDEVLAARARSIPVSLRTI